MKKLLLLLAIMLIIFNSIKTVTPELQKSTINMEQSICYNDMIKPSFENTKVVLKEKIVYIVPGRKPMIDISFSKYIGKHNKVDYVLMPTYLKVNMLKVKSILVEQQLLSDFMPRSDKKSSIIRSVCIRGPCIPIQMHTLTDYIFKNFQTCILPAKKS